MNKYLVSMIFGFMFYVNKFISELINQAIRQ